MARTGMPIGRPKLDPARTVDPPSNIDLLPSTNYVWVEGRVLVEGYDKKKRVHVDRMHQDASALGLVVHEVDITKTNEDDRGYRHWTARRIPIDEAAAGLQDHPEGVTVAQFAEELFKEPPWTELHKKAAIRKTYVVIQKLKQKGELIKTKGGLLFSTRKKAKEVIPPVLLTSVKMLLAEKGEEWPDQAVKQLIHAVKERIKSIGE